MKSVGRAGSLVAAAGALCVAFVGSPNAFGQEAASIPELAAKGVWSATTTYAKDDIVTERGSSWIAKRANTNKVPGQTSPSTAADWQLLARGFNPTGPWSNATKYHPDDLVTHNGQSYRAKLTNINKQPTNASTWELMATKGPKGDIGETGPQGAKGDTGTAGAQGAKGDTGAQGAKGDKGDTGAAGEAGATGPSGVVSATRGQVVGNFPATSPAGYTDICSVTMTPTGGKVLLTGTTPAHAFDFDSMRVRLFYAANGQHFALGGDTYAVFRGVRSGAYSYGSIAFSWIDQPVAGIERTYSVGVLPELYSYLGYSTGFMCVIQAIELKP